MCAFVGFFALAERIAVEVFSIAVHALFPLKVRAVEKGDRVQEHKSRKGDKKHFEKEIAVKAIGRETDSFPRSI